MSWQEIIKVREWIPHIGAEPGRAKEESRITCMRMLKTNQSKITRSQPCCSRQCVAQCLFQLALSQVLWRWYCGNNATIEIWPWFIVVCTFIESTTSTRHYSFPKHFFVLRILSEFAKVFERKVWRVQVANLHNAARALSSPSRCFQSVNKSWKDFFRHWYCDKKQIECGIARYW